MRKTLELEKITAGRTVDQTLERPGNERQAAFAHGFKVVRHGYPEHIRYNGSRHKDHAAYLAGKRYARRLLASNT
jgi:hypothetical protein